MKVSLRSTPFSIFCFGWYMMLVPGAGLMLVPDLLLEVFQLRHSDDYWIPRMVGLLAFIIGNYYYYVARWNISVLYPITVRLRALAALFMVGLWVVGEAGVAILLFASVDVVGSLWTAWTLRK